MNVSQSFQRSFLKSLSVFKNRKDIIYIFTFIMALVAFEAFNFSTTEFALSDLLGDLRFIGIRWATLLSVAFCAIDFAGIARLFAPQPEKEAPKKVWFMFGAWILAATMNTTLTWWGIVMAMQTHPILSTGVVNSSFVNTVTPIFLALMVWVIRVLLVGTLSRKSERTIHKPKPGGEKVLSQRELRQAQSRAAHPVQDNHAAPAGLSAVSVKKTGENRHNYRPEPMYIPMQDETVYQYKGNGLAQRRG